MQIKHWRLLQIRLVRPSSKQVLLKLLQVVQEQHDGEEKEPAKVAAATATPSTPASSFAEAERREPTTSIIQFRPLNFPWNSNMSQEWN